MKVQLRVKSTSCMEWEVADEAKAYYIAKDPAGFLRVLPKADYEPVEEWVDVTDECHINESEGHSMLIMHNRYQVGTAAATACSNLYRLKATGSHGIRVERKKA